MARQAQIPQDFAPWKFFARGLGRLDFPRFAQGGAIRDLGLRIRDSRRGRRSTNEPNAPAGASIAGEREPGMSNKANLPVFQAKIGDVVRNKPNIHRGRCGRDAPMRPPSASRRLPLPPGAGNVKRSQFGGPGSRRAWPALRDGRRNAGRSTGGPVAGAGEPGMSNKANLCVFDAEHGVRREK